MNHREIERQKSSFAICLALLTAYSALSKLIRA